jgi:hypothetical protein
MTTVKHLASYVNQFAAVTDDLEASHINMTFYDDGKFQFLNKAVLDYKPEKEYYASIMSKLFSKIADELTGKNKYNKEEGVNSRRFVYAEDSCISFAQFTVRNSILDCHFVLRSSNTKDTLNYDIQFLYYLCSKVYEMLELKDENCRIRINFNSAHIII